uniref:Uncharacterized protein n=1 Tax=Euplotes crassus TaxID=5936 RepID=A0A7S3NYV2_EUPCR|mmetsp:Transcript_32011/g.31396  ORF Transcript_32011/g.31396 Transcript_32011/m.31396 type:complete len:129 (+) Transcript_32011:1694-2080(+)
MNTLIHYDVQNPITMSSGNSRIKGKTLKDGITRGILKTLKGKAQVIGKVDIEDPANNSLGLTGFRQLVGLQKKKDKEDIAYSVFKIDPRDDKKFMLNELKFKGKEGLEQNSFHFSDEERSDAKISEED